MRTFSNIALDHGLNSNYGMGAQEMSQRAYQAAQRGGETRWCLPDRSTDPPGTRWHGPCGYRGRYDAARDVGEDALDYGRERLGADHYVTIRTATALSIALRRIASGRAE